MSGLGGTGGPAKKLGKMGVGHGRLGEVSEIIHIQLNRAVLFEVYQVLENRFHECGFAIWGQPHKLVFTFIDLEPGKLGERRIEQAQAMRKLHLLDELESALIADANRSRCPFSHSIDGKNGRSFKGRGIESAGSVRTVMDFLQDEAIVAQVTPNQLG